MFSIDPVELPRASAGHTPSPRPWPKRCAIASSAGPDGFQSVSGRRPARSMDLAAGSPCRPPGRMAGSGGPVRKGRVSRQYSHDVGDRSRGLRDGTSLDLTLGEGLSEPFCARMDLYAGAFSPHQQLDVRSFVAHVAHEVTSLVGKRAGQTCVGDERDARLTIHGAVRRVPPFSILRVAA